MTDAVDRGRKAFRRRAWDDAFTMLSAAEAGSPLDPGGLERLAASAHLIGRVGDSIETWARAHHGYGRAGDVVRGARVPGPR